MKVVLFLIYISGLLVLAPRIKATSLTISDIASSLDAGNSLSITASFSGSKSACGNKKYFFRGVFYKENTSNYFGFTQNDRGNWVQSPEQKSDYYQITTNEEGSWSGKLAIKPDIEDSAFRGAGMYLVKIARYTETSTSVTEWSNSLPIDIIYSPPTPTPAPTPHPTPLPSPAPTLRPTPTPSPEPTVKPTIMPTKTPLPTVNVATTSGFEFDIEEVYASTSSVAGITHAALNVSYLAPVLIIGGSLLLVAGSLILLWKYTNI